VVTKIHVGSERVRERERMRDRAREGGKERERERTYIDGGLALYQLTVSYCLLT